MIRWIVCAIAVVLSGCADAGTPGNPQSSFTDSWLSGDIAEGSASTAAPGSAGESYESETAGEDPDESITHEAFIYGEARVTPGESYEGTSEFWVVYYPESGGEEILCEASWTVAALESVPACDGCDFAFLVRYTGINIVTDVAAACEVGGFTVADYENEEFIFGYRNNELLELLDGVWQVAGEASYSVQHSELEYYIEGSY